MKLPTNRRLLLALAPALVALAVSAGPAVAVSDEPDLVIQLPGKPYAGQIAPVYVDAFEEPGHLLYRFDSVIANQGGTLDLFRDPSSGGVRQAIWPGGIPSTAPKPDVEPSAAEAEILDRSSSGAGFEYAVEKTHEHFHISSAARYELQPEGAGARVAEKVGFCMFDSYGPATYFGFSVRGAGNETWCGFNASSQSLVRMGLSPGAADRYSAQREFQWVDITGLVPGPAVIRGEANPLLCVLESDETNNTTEQARVIPGVRATPAAASTVAGARVTFALRGEVVAPEVPARRNGACSPSSVSTACYVFGSALGPLEFEVVDPPDHGTVTLAPGGGLTAEAGYTPAAGFTGEDSFSYVASDRRGLVSAPVSARIAVGNPSAIPATSAIPVATTAVVSRILARRVVRHQGRWRLHFTASGPATLSARLERRADGRRSVRRLASRRIAAGSRRLALGRLSRGRYVVRLALDGRPAGSTAFSVPRRPD